MLRNTLFAMLALLVATATAHAGLFASVEKQVNGGSTAHPYLGFASPTWAIDTALNSGTLQQTWVSYALGLTPSNGERITSLTISITSPVDANHGMLQRWTLDVAEPSEPAVPTPNATTGSFVTNGDSHLIQLGSVTINPPNENIGYTQVGGPPKPANTVTRQYGYSGTMTGLWGFSAADIANQQDGVPQRFAYIVVPRGSEWDMSITVLAGSSTMPGGRTFTDSNFHDTGQFPSYFPEPATFSLLGLALTIGLGVRPHRSKPTDCKP